MNESFYIENIFKIENLTQCQIEQIETMINNLTIIKKENYLFFPEDLVIDKQGNQYAFKFTEEKKSLINSINKTTLQIQDKPIHNSKHILMLLNKLSQLKIYLPTLTQESFIILPEIIEMSKKMDQKKTNIKQKCILYKFSLEKLHKNSQEIIDNHCLSPELVDLIKDPQTDIKEIVFTEKMAIFNIGCILYELFTKQQLYPRKSSFQEVENCLLQYIFLPGFKYQSFLFGQLVQKCTIEEETNSNKRLTFQEAFSQILYIDKCVEYINRAKLEQISIKINDFFSQNSSLHDKLVESLKIKVNHQITGRFYILQNLMKIKFIYILFQKEELECFRDFLIQKLLLQELQELKEFDLIQNKPLNIQNHILNFKDSADEIKEFQIHYSSKYEQILFQLIKGIDEYQYSETSKEHFGQSFNQSMVQDFQKDFHVDLFQENTLRSQLHKLCLLNINSIFLKDQLTINFKPIFTQLINGNPYEIYDKLLLILFGNEIQDNKIKEIIQTIKLNSKQF